MFSKYLGNTWISVNVSGSVPRTFVYNPRAWTILIAGQQQQLTATLIPTDNVNYIQASAIALINVTRTTPIITWSNPADIIYGTKLSDTQLDASASDPITGVTVPDTFIYNPSLGTVLSVGTHTLNTTFTPAILQTILQHSQVFQSM